MMFNGVAVLNNERFLEKCEQWCCKGFGPVAGRWHCCKQLQLQLIQSRHRRTSQALCRGCLFSVAHICSRELPFHSFAAVAELYSTCTEDADIWQNPDERQQ